MPEFPSREFAEKLCEELNKSENYRRVARGWRWPLLFKVTGVSGNLPGFVLELFEGTCKGVRWLEDASKEDADYILSATKDIWLSVIEGKLHPMRAILQRKIVVEKGSYSTIARYTQAAMEIVKAARKSLDP